MIAWVFDYLFAGFLFLMFFMRYLSGPEFFPDEISSFLLTKVSYMGLSSSPRIFWLMTGALGCSIGWRILEKVTTRMAEITIIEKSDGKKYLEKHNIKSFED